MSDVELLMLQHAANDKHTTFMQTLETVMVLIPMGNKSSMVKHVLYFVD